ncbi:unnamed protein product [Penicillium salamii]|uniref:GH16 domain-containing protein n=1 Tax=Penicillium salamii TaxID=1612424 RepID=A0A9W4N2Y7_9EURO|nr:unnamed protein product [Penicillium salamii]CAG8239388.1 unnamed protein product [Penicillium salamii]CAG8248725.1 unnamed protein product [Penicillium salamii]CAG8267822.1 unnamed protein product [Penicillium salamii]CAG8352530.1 unnamed protein product [Penicillium salamii]
MKIRALYTGVAGIVGVYLSVVSTALDTKAPHTPYKQIPRGCDCYTVSGPEPGYFQHYKLWDFRTVDLKKHAHLNLSEPIVDGDGEWEEWEDFDDNYDEPESIDTPELNDTSPSDPTSLVFFKTSFERDWSSQAWERPGTPKSPVLMINSKNNIFFTRDHEQVDPHATYLVLRTTRHDGYTSTAEIETRLRNIYRCSLRVRLRFLPRDFVMAQPPQPGETPPVIASLNDKSTGPNQRKPVHEGLPAPGACAGIFTYHDRNTESDIEILTRDPPHVVHYANQPDYDFEADREIPGASTIATLPVPWTTWATHRLDWFPSISRWLVNGEIQDARTYRVPDLQSMVVLNLWSDGGLWTGDMRLGDSIYMGIEYIELIYNRTTDASNPLHATPQNPLQNAMHMDYGHPASDSKHFICKPGREGRECRRQKFLNRPRAESCHNPCNIDAL